MTDDDGFWDELASIPIPPIPIVDVGEWVPDTDRGPDTYSRTFDIRDWTPPAHPLPASFGICASQIADVIQQDGGWHVENCHLDNWRVYFAAASADDLTSAGARQMAAALIEAADELDRRKANHD
jgi:hypothetical protein